MNKEKISKVLCFLILMLLFAGCARQAVDLTSPGAAYLIESKAQIRNEGESNNVSIEIALRPQKAIRLEISATLGVAVATVLMTPDEISYVLHSPRQFYRGPFHEKTLYPVFKKNIDPKILWQIVHNHSPASTSIKCEDDEKRRPLKCTQSSSGAVMKWVYDEPPYRRIELISDKFELKWIFTSQSYLENDQNETFVLKKPETYKEIIIR